MTQLRITSITASSLTALMGAIGCAATNATAATGSLVINELLASHAGADNTEYVELFGTPGASLEGLSFVVVESDATGAGTIDRRIDFTTTDNIGANGFFLVGNPAGLVTNYTVTPNTDIGNDSFENSSLTAALVKTGSLSGASVTGAEVVLDAVALNDGGTGDTFFFDAPVIGPDGAFFPAGVQRAADGVDTNDPSDWVLADFNLGSGNTPTAGDEPPPPPPVAATIMHIQGAGHRSPLEGERIVTRGIVTAVDSNGFYLQDPFGDDNARTSDGIFVFTGSRPNVKLGDDAEVTGFVTEFVPGGTATHNLSITEITDPLLSVLASGNPLPDPVPIGGRAGRLPPTRIIDNDAFSIFDPRQDGIDFYETLEGMRVTLEDALAVSGTNRFGEIVTVAGRGKHPVATGLSRRGTLNISPNDFNPERVQVQFDSGILPGDPIPVNTGAHLGDVTGVVGYSFGNYEVTLTEPVTPVRASQLTPEVSSLAPHKRRLTVASFNVLNLDPKLEDRALAGEVDDDVGNGRFEAVAHIIAHNLNTPDIVALQEIQDNDGAERSAVTKANETLQRVVDEIAQISGVGYEYIDNPFIGNETSGGQPGGNIRVVFLYNPSRVSLAPQSVQTVVDPVDQQTNPDNPFYDSRLPLAATFTFNGEPVTVVNNHFSSKGGSRPLFGDTQPAVALQEDPAVNGNVDERRAQASAVKAFVDGILMNDPNAHVVVLGDLNEFEFISPLLILEQGLINLTTTLPKDERYSYLFEGNSQSLDHILISESLVHQARFDAVHVNAEFAETPQRASDHDPLLVQVNPGGAR